VIEDIAEFVGFDSALDGLGGSRITVVFGPVGINIAEANESGIVELAKAPEDGLIGPAVFLLNGRGDECSGNPWIEVAFFAEE
jgi:hypothetical protein